MEYLKLQTGASLLHVPYRGTAPSVNDVLAGQVQVLFTGAPALMPHIKAGKLRALAVSSPHRIALLPEVPTVAESGVAGTRASRPTSGTAWWRRRARPRPSSRR
jgi:tripartite-type tricarboxylate transporter receptor subunit TctC